MREADEDVAVTAVAVKLIMCDFVIDRREDDIIKERPLKRSI